MLPLSFKGNWDGLEVIFFRCIGDLKTKFSPYVFREDFEVVRFVGDNPVFIKGERIARQQLMMGKGVLAKDYIMYLKGSKGLPSFRQEFQASIERIESYMDGAVAENLLDYYNFPLVKFIISMYRNSVYSRKITESKLLPYIKEEGIKAIIDKIDSEKMVESA